MATLTAPKTLDSFSPLTGERVGSVPTLQPEEVQAVVDDVASVQPFWAELPLEGRARYMKRASSPPSIIAARYSSEASGSDPRVDLIHAETVS